MLKVGGSRCGDVVAIENALADTSDEYFEEEQIHNVRLDVLMYRRTNNDAVQWRIECLRGRMKQGSEYVVRANKTRCQVILWLFILLKGQ